jgi:hypothetical protein
VKIGPRSYREILKEGMPAQEILREMHMAVLAGKEE